MQNRKPHVEERESKDNFSAPTACALCHLLATVKWGRLLPAFDPIQTAQESKMTGGTSGSEGSHLHCLRNTVEQRALLQTLVSRSSAN